MTRAICAAVALLFLSAPLAAQNAASAGDTVTTASGLKYVITKKVTGKTRKANSGEIISAHYDGTFLDGKVFDSSRRRNRPFEFTLGAGQVIRGWDEGFALLNVGERATLIIPPNLAYGAADRGPIPGNSTLVFDVELLGIKGKGFAELLSQTVQSSGIESAIALYNKQKKKGFGDYYLSEDQLNMLGYAYLQQGMTREALEILKINADAFPKSANVYDSLGEACMAAGDKKAAVKNYRRSLELDPENRNAEEKLKTLGAIK